MKTYTYKGQEMSLIDFFEDVILDCFAEAVFSVDHCVYGDMAEEQQEKVKQTFFEMLEQKEIEKDFDKKIQISYDDLRFQRQRNVSRELRY
ncbi:hypothetical protein [Bacillus licheniformis]|uniref:hypothetical protein n=1 Tax=Bacillus licheniformis TaxID=1402 RepID=UPI0013777A49|nr:hypothetical protein [Bacillus licheniformis]NCL92448.1 hypothetical protein [Bacillus licheniformis]